jgi:hypothetical protein
MAIHDNEALWQRIKNAVMAEATAGTKAGQWSARKAQLAVRRYKDAGGGYKGTKDPKNSLTQWSKQDWTTKSGKPSSETGERYLPRKAIEAMSPAMYARTTRSKRAGTSQYVSQPTDIKEFVRKFRK